MTVDNGSEPDAKSGQGGGRKPRPLSAAAKRALAEAEERRIKRDAEAARDAPPPKEIDGVEGPEPIRYGDWENKGRASDF